MMTEDTHSNDPDITLAEAASDLGVSEASLRAAVDDDRLAARRVGDIWVTTRAEVERYRREDLDEPGLTSMDAEGDDGQVFGG